MDKRAIGGTPCFSLPDKPTNERDRRGNRQRDATHAATTQKGPDGLNRPTLSVFALAEGWGFEPQKGLYGPLLA